MGKKNPIKKRELRCVLTVVGVESLLNRIHICSSRHASENCSICKPKQKKHNNRIITRAETQGWRNDKALRQPTCQRTYFSFLELGAQFSKESQCQIFPYFEAPFPLTSNALSHTRWRMELIAI